MAELDEETYKKTLMGRSFTTKWPNNGGQFNFRLGEITEHGRVQVWMDRKDGSGYKAEASHDLDQVRRATEQGDWIVRAKQIRLIDIL